MNETQINYKSIVFEKKPIDVNNCLKFVLSPKCGAINTFLGVIRDMDRRQNKLHPIKGIYYEAYEDMAIGQIDTIIEDSISRHVDSNCRVFIGVRLGFVPVGEASLIISISSTNRSVSHEATLTILEKIKSSVAIWKKVHFIDCDAEWADASKSEAYWLKSGNDANKHD